MKALLTTIVDNVNYGTYLQAYATVSLLERKGWEVDVLNYTRPHLNHRNMLRKATHSGVAASLKSIPLILLDSYLKWNLKRFLTERASMTGEFTDKEDFAKKTAGPYDLYLVGSDQVWNSTHNHGIDEVFFFGGVSGRKRSYAASVGIESFPEKEYKHISSLLKEFDLISVRESFGVDALKQIGIDNARQVLDPTLMIKADEWAKISNKRFVKRKPYLLVYSVEVSKDTTTIEIARKIARERGLEIYVVSPYPKFNSRLKVDEVFSMADVSTFLALFSQADYAVVSSFHGTAFAINFNCQFVTVSPERFSTRVQSLLKLLGLEDRYVKNISELPASEIDYETVNSILTTEREKSDKVLSEITKL